MKAWHVSNKYEPDYGSMIVFAETRGKAQAMAMSSELGEDSEWNDLIWSIAQHESKQNANARNGQYLGILQISPVLVNEGN